MSSYEDTTVDQNGTFVQNAKNKVTFDEKLRSAFVWILGYFEHRAEVELIICPSRVKYILYDFPLFFFYRFVCRIATVQSSMVFSIMNDMTTFSNIFMGGGLPR